MANPLNHMTPQELLAEGRRVWERLDKQPADKIGEFCAKARPAPSGPYGQQMRTAAAAALGMGELDFKIARKLAQGHLPEVCAGVDLASPPPAIEEGRAGLCALRMIAAVDHGQGLREASVACVGRAMASLWEPLGIGADQVAAWRSGSTPGGGAQKPGAGPAGKKAAKPAKPPGRDPRQWAAEEAEGFERARAAFWQGIEQAIGSENGVKIEHADLILAQPQFSAPWAPSAPLAAALERANIAFAALAAGATAGQGDQGQGDQKGAENQKESESAPGADAQAAARQEGIDRAIADAEAEGFGLGWAANWPMDETPADERLADEGAARERGEDNAGAGGAQKPIKSSNQRQNRFEPEGGWRAQTLTPLRALALLKADKETNKRIKAELTQRREAEKAAEERERAERRRAAEKEREERDAKWRWESKLVHAADMPAWLGVTKTEYLRWREEGRIKVSAVKEFRKWGRRLEASLHHPDDLLGVTPAAIAQWRDEHKAEVSLRRKTGAQSAKQTRGANQAVARAVEAGFEPCWGRQEERERFPALWRARRPVTISLMGQERAVAAVVSLRLSTGPDFGECDTLVERLKRAAEKVGDASVAAQAQKPIEAAIAQLGMGAPPQGAAATDPDHDEHDPRWASLLDKLSQPVNLDELNSASLVARLRQAQAWHAKHKASHRAQRGFHLEDYAASFPRARAMGRSLRVITGPTNSGKTHEALEALKSAASGVYLAPLRLLAMEVHDRLTAEGIACDLRTGEERISTPGARHVCATVEMMSPSEEVEVAVIDECQMLLDPQRGAAWTSALAGVAAKRVYALGAPCVEPVVRKLAEHLGEACESVAVERKTPLETLGHSVGLSSVRRGDAVVAFSRKAVLRISAQLRDEGLSVATIYGALAPEVRRFQADLFNSGRADALVATDAIGMGMNLPIARVIFDQIEKFDGEETRPLTPAEARQIGGRAGRFGLHAQGEVAALRREDAAALQAVMSQAPREQIGRLQVAPSLAYAEAIAQRLGTASLRAVLAHFERGFDVDHAMFEKSVSSEMTALAQWTERHSAQLSVGTQFKYACAPISSSKDEELSFWLSSMEGHAKGRVQRMLPIPSWVDSSKRVGDWAALQEAETLSKLVGVYAWLAQAFPAVYPDAALVAPARQKLARHINASLAKQVVPAQKWREEDWW